MGRPSHSPIWPFLLVVAFLFLLCIIAPREWQQMSRRELPTDVATEPFTETDFAQAQAPAASSSGRHDRVPIAATLPATEACASPAEFAEMCLEPADAYLATTGGDSSACEQPATNVLVNEGPTESVADEPIETIATTERNPDAASAESTEGTQDIQSPVAEDSSSGIEVEPRATSAEKPPASRSQWATPVDLVRRLELLACECECTDWAYRTAELVDELCVRTSPSDERAVAIIGELRTLASQVDELVPEIGARATVIELLRVRHALVRRLDVWEFVPTLFAGQRSAGGPREAALDRLDAAIDRLDDLTAQAGAEGQQWRRYLALDTLRRLGHGKEIAPQDAQQLAREITGRLNRTDLSTGQRKFISSPPVTELAAALRPWNLEALDPQRLLGDIERFETTMQASDARHLADDYLRTTWLDSAPAELAQRLETNYRNANLRLVITEKMLKRVMPGLSTTTDPVRDQILGVPTRGTSTTSTLVDVKLVPDKDRLRVALEASGQVLANTSSNAGPATLRTHSDSLYFARKILDLDLHGIRTQPAEAECLGTQTRLRSVDTSLDGVPLVGALMENVVRSRHADKEDAVRSELRRKVEAQARRKMDTETEQRLQNVNRLLQERVVEPLERLSLDPQVISAETSKQRLTMRVRLAGQEQLAGHTPRPRAPSDSLFSLQVHQSVFNNICEQLQLDGRTFRLPELREHIIRSLNLGNSRFMDETDQDVTITFADADALRVRCEEGRIELNLAVARMTSNDSTWKNFQVRVYYRPEVEGLQARLVRDGIVQLIGGRQLRSQIALRGIFSKAFAKERDLVLVDPKWSSDERTRDLAFSQFAIQDGWIAVAVNEPPENLARKKTAAEKR